MITLTDFPNFTAKDTLECGQIFRYKLLDNGDYGVFSQDKYARVHSVGNTISIITDDEEYFRNFFDLETDYVTPSNRLASSCEVLGKAVEYGKGIRILNQDLTEMIISFIISQNNNIKRIQLIIERLCEAIGAVTPYGKAFPTVQALASKDEQFYLSMGCGYRASYLAETSRRLADFDVDSLRSMTTEQARNTLLGFKGIGPKVADCILLFGLKRNDTFPVDTWMKKVYHSYFEQGHKDSEISKFFIEKFGCDAGLCQQYLFYYQRQLDK